MTDSDPRCLSPEVFERVRKAIAEQAGKPLRIEANGEIEARMFAEWLAGHHEYISPEQMAAKLESFGLRPWATAFCTGHAERDDRCPSCLTAGAMRYVSTVRP